MKYHSILQAHRIKDIGRFVKYNPALEDEIFVITEKLHGANISLLFEQGKPFKVFSRYSEIQPGEDFYGVWDVLKTNPYQKLIGFLDQHSFETLQIYGELIPIADKVKYGEPKILFFDLVIDDIYLPFNAFCKFIGERFMALVVPVIDTVRGLNAALEFSSERDSLILNEPNNMMEGIVVKPRFNNYFYGGSIFYVKKRNAQKLLAKARLTRSEIPYVPPPLHEVFVQYITEDRLDSVFSKWGPIKSKSELGRYIKLVIEDAKEDFLADYEGEEGLDNRKIYDVGDLVLRMLRNALS